jgi:hypothetical protein
LDFIDHLSHAIDPGHNFLGNLLLMEAEQPTSEEKNAVLALARNPSHGFVWAGPQALRCGLDNGGAIDSRGLVHITSMHKELPFGLARNQLHRQNSAWALQSKAVLKRNRWEGRRRGKRRIGAADLANVGQDCG